MVWRKMHHTRLYADSALAVARIVQALGACYPANNPTEAHLHALVDNTLNIVLLFGIRRFIQASLTVDCRASTI